MDFRILLTVILIFLLILPAQALQIVRFCPDTYLKGEGDEYFVLEGQGTLRGVLVTDGEGGARFPDNAKIHGEIVVARYGSAFLDIHGYPPDYEIFDTGAAIPDMVQSGNLQMANSGDELILIKERKELQTVSWPGDVVSREGQVHYFEDGVWDKRPLFIGQSRFAPAEFYDVTLTAFVSPDCSYDVMETAIEGADEYILLNVYEFTGSGIAGMITGACERDVEVTVLLEGGPVGGIPPEEYTIVTELERGGAVVRQITTSGDAHAKYRFDHAKYIVADGDAVLITSENFKPSGIPETGSRGNRGWGVYIENTGVAGYFEDVFYADITGGDIIPFPAGRGEVAEDHYSAYTPEFSPARFSGAKVIPVLSPDTSVLVEDLLKSAEQSIDIEQAYIKNWSGGEANPYLEAAIDASRRGVSVRVLLDSFWFNIHGDNDNDEMAAYINTLAERENLPLEARLIAFESNGPVKIHNKGVIIDCEKVLVSSINWNENSPSFNREAGVIIEHTGAGQYYTAVFEDDWSVSVGVETEAGTGTGDFGGQVELDDLLKPALAVFAIGVLFGIYLKRRV